MILILTFLLLSSLAPQAEASKQAFDDISCNISSIRNDRFNRPMQRTRHTSSKNDVFFDSLGNEFINMEPLMKRAVAFDQEALLDTKLFRPKRAKPLAINIPFSNTAFLFQITADKSARITLSPPAMRSRKTSDILVKQDKDGCYILMREPHKGKWNLGVQSLGTVTVKAGNLADLFLGNVSFKRVVFTATGPKLTTSLTRLDRKDFLKVQLKGAQRFLTNKTKFTLRDRDGTVLKELPSLYIGYGTFIMKPFPASKQERWLHVETVDEFRRTVKRKHHLAIDKNAPTSPFRNVQNINPNSDSVALNTAGKILGTTQIQAYERAWNSIIDEGTYSDERLLELYQKYSRIFP